MTIGEKIKKQRLALGKTQSQIAGKEITRNMLSLIENGMCSPSVETVRYLASALGVSPGYLLSEEDDLPVFQKNAIIDKLRNAYRNGHYDIVLQKLEHTPSLDDELALLGAESAYVLGTKSVAKGSLASAKRFFETAKDYAEKTIYNTELILAKISMYTAICDHVQSPLLTFSPSSYLYAVEKQCELEFFKYLTQDFSYPFKTPLLKLHMEGKALMREKRYLDAIKALHLAEEYKNPLDYHAFVMLGVYTDLESCYRDIGDFEMAYRYVTKRTSMTEWFKT